MHETDSNRYWQSCRQPVVWLRLQAVENEEHFLEIVEPFRLIVYFFNAGSTLYQTNRASTTESETGESQYSVMYVVCKNQYPHTKHFVPMVVNSRAGHRPDDRPAWKRPRGCPRQTWIRQLEIDVGLTADAA